MRSVTGWTPLGGGRDPTSEEPREMGAEGRGQTGEGLRATEERVLGLGRGATIGLLVDKPTLPCPQRPGGCRRRGGPLGRLQPSPRPVRRRRTRDGEERTEKRG